MRRATTIWGARYPRIRPPSGTTAKSGMVSAPSNARASPTAVKSSMESSRSARNPDALSPIGRPARFSFSWSASVLPWPALRLRRLPTLSRNGRTTRSKSGSDISTSASVAGARPASANCARRASSRSPWRGDTDIASPNAMSRMPPPRAAARPIASRLTSNLDLHDLLDRDGPDCDREDRHAEHDVPERVGDHRIEIRRGDERQEAGKCDRQDRDDPSRCACLRSERANFALDADALTNRERDRVKNLGEVTADHALDLHCGDHEVEVLGLVAHDHVVERFVDVDAERDFTRCPREFLGDRRVGILRDRRERLCKRVPCLEGVAQKHQRVTELIVECACASLLAELEEETAQEVDDDGAGDEGDRRAVAERDEQTDQDAQADDCKQPFRRLELEVRLLQVVRELAGVRRAREERVEAARESVEKVADRVARLHTGWRGGDHRVTAVLIEAPRHLPSLVLTTAEQEGEDREDCRRGQGRCDDCGWRHYCLSRRRDCPACLASRWSASPRGCSGRRHSRSSGRSRSR